MKTYQYNYNGEIKFLRANSRDDAVRKIFFGELKRNGSCDLLKIDLKVVRDPGGGTLRQAQDDRGNAITNQLRHI